MAMSKGMVGKIGPASVDLTLADYIQRKTRDDAFNAVKAESLDLVEDMFRFFQHERVFRESNGTLHIPFLGEELVLRPDGQWFYNDTSGG